MKVALLPLNELYARPKITPAVERAILEKENFSQISATYCEKVCRLQCKSPQQVTLLNQQVDILIVQDHEILNGKYDRLQGAQARLQRDIAEYIAKKAGFNGLTYRLVNLLKCKPEDPDYPLGKTPTQTTLLKCRPYLYEEIRRAKPKVIISLTTAVTKALGLPKHSNTRHRGHIVLSPFGPVVLSLHHKILSMIRQTAQGASGMWSADYFEVIRRDWEKAARIAKADLMAPSLEFAIEKVKTENITVCRSLDQVRALTHEILSLPSSHLVSWDIETTGLDPWAADAKILCSQFCYKLPGSNQYKSVVIPLWHRENKAFDANQAWEHIVPILTGPTPKIVWNGKFDLVYTVVTTGVRARNIEFDGMLLLHMLDSGANGTYSLKSAVADFMPESGLQGYEDSLPALTKGAGTSENTGEEVEEESESNDE